MIETTCVDRGICCNSCQENVNIHGCEQCMHSFEGGDRIICVHHSQRDCEHYHVSCYKKRTTEEV